MGEKYIVFPSNFFSMPGYLKMEYTIIIIVVDQFSSHNGLL